MKHFVVLQAQPWREQDWLLDVFGQFGRQRLLLNKPSTPPGLFHHYQGDWPNQTLPAIRAWQSVKHCALTGTALYCGLYMNELLGLLLPDHEPCMALFNQYQHSLTALAQEQLPDPWLRLFEGQLLHTLGYGVVWHQDSQARPIHPLSYYQFKPRQGFELVGQQAQHFSGADLLAIHQGSRDPLHWRMIRNIMRAAFDDILPRPLVSRELLASHLLQERKE